MAKSTKSQPANNSVGTPTALRVARDEATQKLKTQVRKGEALLKRETAREDDLGDLKHDVTIWSEYNEELVRQLFTDDRNWAQYAATNISLNFFGNKKEWWEEADEYRSIVQERLRILRSIIERLPLLQEPVPVRPPSPQQQNRSSTGDGEVFVVHGRSDGPKETVARFLEKLRLKATILHEQPNRGRTVIEKFEDHAQAAFAVVIMTADDVGGLKGADLRPRARQNVVLELGFFLGQLGRSKVCVLHEPSVELPSDYAGVVFLSLGDSAWRLLLAKELKAAGLGVDLNDAL